MLDGGLTRGTRGISRWGDFNDLQLRRVSLPAIRQHWDDMVRVAGSLATGQVRAHDLIKMTTAAGAAPAWAARSRTTGGSSRRCTCCGSSAWRSTAG